MTAATTTYNAAILGSIVGKVSALQIAHRKETSRSGLWRFGVFNNRHQSGFYLSHSSRQYAEHAENHNANRRLYVHRDNIQPAN